MPDHRSRSSTVAAHSEAQAAALPWRASAHGIEILLVTTSSGKEWILPKGGVKHGESLPDAAAREAQEEAGLVGTIERQEIGRYSHRKTEDDDEVVCEVHVFPLAVGRSNDEWKESDERQRRWVPANEISEFVEERELAKLIVSFAQGQV